MRVLRTSCCQTSPHRPLAPSPGRGSRAGCPGATAWAGGGGLCLPGVGWAASSPQPRPHPCGGGTGHSPVTGGRLGSVGSGCGSASRPRRGFLGGREDGDGGHPKVQARRARGTPRAGRTFSCSCPRPRGCPSVALQPLTRGWGPQAVPEPAVPFSNPAGSLSEPPVPISNPAGSLSEPPVPVSSPAGSLAAGLEEGSGAGRVSGGLRPALERSPGG